MPKYDAFGREIGDDPLETLRETTNPVPAEPPRVEVAAPEDETAAWSGGHEPESAPPQIVIAPPEFVRPRRRRRGFPVILVLGVIVAGIGLAANSVVDEGKDLIDRAIPELPDVDVDAAPDASPPAGLQAESLILEDNFADAIKTLAGSGLGRPTSLRIAPDRIDAQLLEGGTIHVVQITPDGELRDFGSSQGSGPVIAFKAIDPAAPERIVRKGATRKSPARDIDYVFISRSPSQTVGAYFKNGRIVIGDAHGRPQRVL